MSNTELLQRLQAFEQAELAETMLELARLHPRNARVVQDLLEMHDGAYMAELPKQPAIPARQSGMTELAYARHLAEALNGQQGRISSEELPDFLEQLRTVLATLENEGVEIEEALAVARLIEESADNLRSRSAGHWPEVSTLVCGGTFQVQAALLRRSPDRQFVQEVLFERFKFLDGVPEAELESLARELLPVEELEELIEELLSEARLSGNPMSTAAVLMSAAALAAKLPDPRLYHELREDLDMLGADMPEDPAQF